MADVATLSSEFQISIPKAVREHQQWEAGQKLVFVPKGKGVLLVPGSRFDLPGHARLGYCAPEPVLRAGLAGLGRALRRFD